MAAAKNIFICYRRDDAEGYAGRLYDRLNSRFPRRIFMDVTGILPGADFTRVISETVGTCHVLLAIIGRHWATVTDSANRRRLELADDTLRHEIATALSRNIIVIPVLVRGAEMPSREMLPPDLAQLSTRNAIEISDGDFDHDVQRLIGVLENACGEPPPVQPRPYVPPKGRNNCLIFAVIGVVVIGVGIILFVLALGLLASQSQGDQSGLQPAPRPVYSPADNRPAPTAETNTTDQAGSADFQPVGSWIMTFTLNDTPVHNELIMYDDKSYKSDDQIGTWEYSPSERKLTLFHGVTYLVITIEGREGNAFVGAGQSGQITFPIRLVPN